MGTKLRKFLRSLLTAYLLVIHLLLIYFAAEFVYGPLLTFEPLTVRVDSPVNKEPVPTPLSGEDDLAALGFPTPTPPPMQYPPGTQPGLMIPVAGVRPDQLLDTFNDARDGERQHRAIDIAAAEGTPVLAATDGPIVRFYDSEAGGITIYQLNTNRTLVFYYAHLQRRVESLKEGDFVRKGSVIGYVGDTGNAGPGNFHLHFSIARITSADRYFEGENINPYLYLTNPSLIPE
ncbi:MAG TPA: M23 family metallopeptidase [Pyrinomonadaceae bacterium]|nr:M23 family metallopeptidase [Pyrinomonadaceae bacterium]